MPSLFYAVFGSCRRAKGGTKAKCYKKAITAVKKKGKNKRKPKVKRKARKTKKRGSR